MWDHPSLRCHLLPVRLQVFLTQTHLAIAMEYAQGGDMFRYICRHRPHCRLLESQARWIFQQLIIGLDYCHNKVRFNVTSALLLGSKVAAAGPRGSRHASDTGFWCSSAEETIRVAHPPARTHTHTHMTAPTRVAHPPHCEQASLLGCMLLVCCSPTRWMNLRRQPSIRSARDDGMSPNESIGTAIFRSASGALARSKHCMSSHLEGDVESTRSAPPSA